ncbi:MAG: molecular chaperone TorD family protein [Rhodospirillales bacterium]|nr:molecular chaperone TorD family protein [Rhodospirillales bacterium]
MYDSFTQGGHDLLVLAQDLARAVEFTALFTGPGEHFSPHESVQLEGGTGELWGKEAVAVKSFIERAGFAYTEELHGLPDPISVEMEFLAQIMAQEGAAWREGDMEKAPQLPGI